MPKTKDEFRTILTPNAATVIRKGTKYDKAFNDGKHETSLRLKEEKETQRLKKARRFTSNLSGAIHTAVKAEMKAEKDKKNRKHDDHGNQDYGK